MTRLLFAELSRLRSRRVSWIALLGIVLVLIGLQFVVFTSVKPLSSQETAEAQVQLQQAKKEYDANQEENKASEQDCVDQGGTAEQCNSEPKLEWFTTRAVVPFGEISTVAVTVSVFLTGLAFLFLGASFIGAEYSTGALGNWLSFVPQRGKVFSSKLLAVVLAAAAVSAVVSALTLGLAAMMAKLAGADLTSATKAVELAGRGILLAVICAVVGFCLAMLTRHTIAAAGTVLGYLFIAFVLGVVTNVVPSLQKVKAWTPENNLLAFVQHGFTYTNYLPVSSAEGVNYQEVSHTISFADGTIYWSVVVVVAVAVTFAVFRRRDVN